LQWFWQVVVASAGSENDEARACGAGFGAIGAFFI
jgi:hypothetical protein